MSLEGRAYGPIPISATARAVADFVAATGDDPARWVGHAPPAFAAAALFAVAPEFLDAAGSTGEIRSLLHSEQTYRWHRALEIGETVEVGGRVASVRERGPLRLVAFEVEGAGPERLWFEGRAGFVMSSDAAAAASEEPEPAATTRAVNDPADPLPLPAPGEPLPPLRRSASRADLVRYAGATRDWNPIHWDHAAARAAGLPGVVVHGLLMTAWLAQAAARHVPGPHPLQQLRARFRGPLRPGAQALISGETGREAGAPLELRLAEGGRDLVIATVVVTP